MEVLNIYQKEFRRKLLELGFKIREVSENTFRLDLNKDRLNTITAKLIGSSPICKYHGSKNNTEIKAIGFFKFKLSPEGKEPNFYIFAFPNTIDIKVEFLLIAPSEMITRLNQRKRITNENMDVELVFWLMPEGHVIETYGLGTEAEWWFIGSRMATGTNMDYTKFLNQWQLLK